MNRSDHSLKSILVILRGNSGSGKTTTAKALQQQLGEGTMLISQDVIRREMLSVKDTVGNLSVELIKKAALFGYGKCEVVIVEGILDIAIYGEMLMEVAAYFDDRVCACYYEIPFAETLNRHNTREKNNEFGKEEMQSWWLEKDYLGISEEKIISENFSSEDVVQLLMQEINRLKSAF